MTPMPCRTARSEVVHASVPPHRIVSGRSFAVVAELCRGRLRTWEEWEPQARRAFGATPIEPPTAGRATLDDGC
jgi:hypothetical protein